MPDVGIELGTACMPRGHASDQATMPGVLPSLRLPMVDVPWIRVFISIPLQLMVVLFQIVLAYF